MACLLGLVLLFKGRLSDGRLESLVMETFKGLSTDSNVPFSK